MTEVPLPKDHEGREIPLDTLVLYDAKGVKMYVSSERCGKRTPNYREYSPSLAAIVGVQGRSWCDECRRELRILHEWENEQETDERMICPYCGGSISDPFRLRFDLSMRGAGSLREDSTLCLLWAMLMDSYWRWRTTDAVFVETGEDGR